MQTSNPEPFINAGLEAFALGSDELPQPLIGSRDLKHMLYRFFSFILTLGVAGCVVSGTDPASFASKSAPPNYVRYLVPKGDHPFRYSRQGEPVRAGIVSERYELRDGDCGGDDCVNPRFRTESVLKASATQARFNQDIWYGWSFYNQNIQSYPQSIALKNVFGQWKMGGFYPPHIKLVQIGRGEAYRGGNRSHDVVIQMDDANEAFGWGKSRNWGIVCRLFSIDEARGKWIDIVMNTNFGTDQNGYLRIWINGQQRCDYRGPIVAVTDTSRFPGPNHRRGIYVSSTKRWDATQPSVKKPTQIAFYDEFRIGRSRSEVDIRLIEQAGLPPVD